MVGPTEFLSEKTGAWGRAASQPRAGVGTLERLVAVTGQGGDLLEWVSELSGVARDQNLRWSVRLHAFGPAGWMEASKTAIRNVVAPASRIQQRQPQLFVSDPPPVWGATVILRAIYRQKLAESL